MSSLIKRRITDTKASGQLHGFAEPSAELLEAERLHQEESSRSVQMLAICIFLLLIALAIWAGWTVQ